MARKKQRSDELLAPDAFQQQGSGWTKWLEQNIRFVLIGIAVVLLLVVGLQFVTAQSERSASELTSKFGAALDQYREATDPSLAETATSTEIIERKERQARKAFEEVRTSVDEKGPARLALLYEADLAARVDDHAAAAALYADYLERSPKDDPLRWIALEGAGYAHEALESWDEALEYFEELEKISFYEQWALKHQARVYEAKGEDTKAIAALEELLDSEPEAFLKNYAESQLKLLR
jgi:tetratricopeptide (TPR) repeat protein